MAVSVGGCVGVFVTVPTGMWEQRFAARMYHKGAFKSRACSALFVRDGVGFIYLFFGMGCFTAKKCIQVYLRNM